MPTYPQNFGYEFDPETYTCLGCVSGNIAGSPFTATLSGNLTSITIWLDNVFKGITTLKALLYNANTLAYLGQTAERSDLDDKTFNTFLFAVPIAITKGTDYILAIYISDGSVNYGITLPPVEGYQYDATGVYPAPPDPLVITNTVGRVMSIYGTIDAIPQKTSSYKVKTTSSVSGCTSSTSVTRQGTRVRTIRHFIQLVPVIIGDD